MNNKTRSHTLQINAIFYAILTVVVISVAIFKMDLTSLNISIFSFFMMLISIAISMVFDDAEDDLSNIPMSIIWIGFVVLIPLGLLTTILNFIILIFKNKKGGDEYEE